MTVRCLLAAFAAAAIVAAPVLGIPPATPTDPAPTKGQAKDRHFGRHHLKRVAKAIKRHRRHHHNATPAAPAKPGQGQPNG